MDPGVTDSDRELGLSTVEYARLAEEIGTGHLTA